MYVWCNRGFYNRLDSPKNPLKTITNHLKMHKYYKFELDFQHFYLTWLLFVFFYSSVPFLVHCGGKMYAVSWPANGAIIQDRMSRSGEGLEPTGAHFNPLKSLLPVGRISFSSTFRGPDWIQLYIFSGNASLVC